ncbi:hypothetical protein ACTXT7_013022 [Hymenolepis weldensis]
MATDIEGEIPQIPEQHYEHLDHTADVQIHAWGKDIKEAFEQAAMGMFSYMTTDYDSVDIKQTCEVEVEGSDMENLLFRFLDEWLFAFSADDFFFPRSVGYGEPFDLNRHPQGTEVKAITYSNMQIYDKDNKHEVFVIVDI